jgi:hypothetical protein
VQELAIITKPSRIAILDICLIDLNITFHFQKKLIRFDVLWSSMIAKRLDLQGLSDFGIFSLNRWYINKLARFLLKIKKDRLKCNIVAI